MRVTLTLDGTTAHLDVEPGRTLAEALGHRSTCPDGTCGTCAVRVDGDEIRSCLMLAVQAGGTRVTRVAGNAAGRDPR
ncbi:2Fe-2S iron-sulfur cluster-binding protein [Actinoplanes xinjiangensis]|uniref:2Fe-2S iron-sulfur cluster-binding protein n=1 Tax=Actinoplanes xinjiangensis TaxID=512350 RepID=UPI00341F6456